MAVARMKLVQIAGRFDSLDEVVRSCCIRGDFQPEAPARAAESNPGFAPLAEENPYAEPLQKAVELGARYGLHPRYQSFEDLGMDDNAALAAATERMAAALRAYSAKSAELAREIAGLTRSRDSLGQLLAVDSNLDALFACRNVAIRFGNLPAAGYAKLAAGGGLEGAPFFTLSESRLSVQGFYVAEKELEPRAEEYYTSLQFDALEGLAGLHGLPRDALESVEGELRAANGRLLRQKEAMEQYLRENEKTYLQVYSKLRYLHDSFAVRRYAVRYRDSFYIFGWVREDEAESFQRRFREIPGADCVVENAEEAGEMTPPTSLVNGKASRPFEGFTRMFGLPAYRELDPTSFMAAVYSLFFGIMFGDLGQGFTILLIALYMKRRRMFLGDILIRCGACSMVFGLLYNSVFGFENLLPFTVLPVHESSAMTSVLLLSVGLGALLILVSMALNVINGIRQRDLQKALFDQNGIAGLLFYSAVIAAAALGLSGRSILTPAFVAVFIVLPLVLIAFKGPLAALCERKKDWAPKNPGEFFLLAFFELFEVLLSFLSNTISYVRIGAFVLSHSAMMLAVFSIASMTGGGGPVVIVLGNALVIGLEGLVVGIQDLRLQFYEIFSRFFAGTGKPYEPAGVKYDG